MDVISLQISLCRYLRNTTVHGNTGELSFDDTGARSIMPIKIYNLVTNFTNQSKHWKYLGHYHNTFRVSTIVWPGNTISGPITKGRRLLRVVTATVEPFVMAAQSEDSGCNPAVVCLKVQTHDKETLDHIFKDYEHDVINQSRPYEVFCCQGLSIVMLEKLSRDMDFRYQLYIVADDMFGHVSSNGNWTGLVGDLMNGAAHMSVGALSITNSRNKVIDFTDPYFFSAFAILVAERKRETPITAWMEPFDSWVWSTIFISASVAAVAVSLLEWNSPFGLNPWGRKRKVNYTLGSGLNMVYAILFQHTVKTKSPKAWPSKWLQNFWAGASIFIYSSYTANLAAFLAGKNSGVSVTGIHDPKVRLPLKLLFLYFFREF